MDTSPPDCTAVITSPSGKRILIDIVERTDGQWKVFRDDNGREWLITGEKLWDTRDEVISFIENRGWSVEIVV
jgi:hypothetical protein